MSAIRLAHSSTSENITRTSQSLWTEFQTCLDFRVPDDIRQTLLSHLQKKHSPSKSIKTLEADEVGGDFEATVYKIQNSPLFLLELSFIPTVLPPKTLALMASKVDYDD